MKIYDLRQEECKEEKIGIAYSGAGARGVIHLGVIKAFIDLKIKPTHIAGASAGSIAASVHAFNPESFDTVTFAVGVVKKLKASDFGLSFWQIFLRVLSERTHLQAFGDLTNFQKKITSESPFQTFSDLKVSLSIVTTDRLNGQEVWIEEGPLIPAMIKSSALPVAFPPVVEDGKVYVDGGLTDGLPLFKLVEKGCGTIYAINMGYSGQLVKPPANLVDNLLGSIDILGYQKQRYEAALLKALYPKIKVYEIKPNVAFDLPGFNFTADRIEPIVEESFQKAKELIQTSH